MKKIAGTIFVFFSLLATSFAQQPKIEDPARWTYEAKKINANEYELVYRLKLEEGWHVWSLKPGGDGYEIVPSFTLDKAAGATVKSELTEKGHASTVLMDGMDNQVTYLSGDIEYKQIVKVKSPGKITGQHEYQVCNDKLCLPPKTKKFEIVVN